MKKLLLLLSAILCIVACNPSNTPDPTPQPEPTPDKYPAFVWCKSLGDGWYIPSVNELRELLIIGSGNTFTQAIVKNKATRFSGGKYLSSTEMDQFWMYYVDFETFIEEGNYKQYTYSIRAIHAF